MNNSLVLLPILIPLTGAPVALLLRRRPKVQAGWALGVMLTALACSLLLLAQVWRGGPMRRAPPIRRADTARPG